jgi:hypothetical protein
MTDVGPELEGTGKYTWSLEGAPLLNNCTPGEEGDNELTKQVLNTLGDDAATRGATCRKIVFTIRSHDQGWGGSAADKGTYRGSFTWFDVGLERVVAKREGKSTIPSSWTFTDLHKMMMPKTRSSLLLVKSFPPLGNPEKSHSHCWVVICVYKRTSPL